MADETLAAVTRNADLDRFELQLDGDVAVLEYRETANKLELTHTEVPPAFEGRGLGSRLVRSAFDYARDHNLTVVPLCPFVLAYVRRHPETRAQIDRSGHSHAR